MDNNAVRYFQWLAGERQGEVLIFDNVSQENGIVFINFKDGSRINEDLVLEIGKTDATDKIMAEVENYTNIWKFNTEWVGREEERWETDQSGKRQCVQPLIEGRKVIHLIPPNPPTKKNSNFGEIVTNKVEHSPIPEINIETKTTQHKAEVVKVIESNPVHIMVDKAKKTDAEVQMVINMSLPGKSLYNVIDESFEDGGKEAIEYIIDNLDISDIKNSLKDGIRLMYTGEIFSFEQKELEDNRQINNESLGDPISMHNSIDVPIGTELYTPETVIPEIVGEPIIQNNSDLDASGDVDESQEEK